MAIRHDTAGGSHADTSLLALADVPIIPVKGGMTPVRDTISGILSGVSGEYFVAAELSRMGYIASITLRNTKGVDILASSADASKSVGIQVKTNRGSRRAWVLNKKAEDYYADNLFYVFVNLNNGQPPDFYIVLSKIVANQVSEGHRRWLKTPGRHGRPHKDTPMRMFGDKENRYLSKWDLLGRSR